MRSKIIIGLIIIQVIVISVLLVPHEYKLLNSANTVCLKTVPIDPMDLMRGHYAIVRYEISRIPKYRFKIQGGAFENSYKKNGNIYVILKKKEGYWLASTVQKTPPFGKVFIKGIVANYEIVKNKKHDYYNEYVLVSYGIEKIFISEKKAKSMEFSGKPFAVTVKLGPEGQPSVTAINKIRRK